MDYSELFGKKVFVRWNPTKTPFTAIVIGISTINSQVTKIELGICGTKKSIEFSDPQLDVGYKDDEINITFNRFTGTIACSLWINEF